MMIIDVLTLFPNMIKGLLEDSILKRAIDNNILQVNLIDYREYSTNKQKKVDDYSFSGGAGMLIKIEPVHKALTSIKGYDKALKILMSPSGKTLNQEMVERLSKNSHIILICGHYEGIDSRILNYVDEEISIGDYVLMGGEVPAMCLIEAISRLIDGVITKESFMDESFTNNLLEYPQFTHPRVYDGVAVPDILLSGHHKNINDWKRYQSLKKTYEVRPDLLNKSNLTLKDYQMLWEIKNEKNN